MPPPRSDDPQRNLSFLDTCSPEAVRLLAMLGEEVRPQAGEDLTGYVGGDQEMVFVVLAGSARVERRGRAAKRVGRGDLLWVGAKAGVTIAEEPMRLLQLELSAFERILDHAREPAKGIL